MSDPLLVTDGSLPPPVAPPPTPTEAAPAPHTYRDPNAAALGLDAATTFQAFTSWIYRNLPGPAAEALQEFTAWTTATRATVDRWSLEEDLSVKLSWGQPTEIEAHFRTTGERRWRAHGRDRTSRGSEIPDGLAGDILGRRRTGAGKVRPPGNGGR